jgi:hypothetical protein
VGSTSDSNGIIAEVELLCRNHPSVQLLVAASAAYEIMSDRHI